MYVPSRWAIRLVAASTFLVLVSCGGGSRPSAPTQPSPSVTPAVRVTAVTVGIPGNGAPTLVPGDKLQLFAVAQRSDGTTADVTNLAVWQSSNPAVATVSNTGLVTAAAEGEIELRAAYEGVSGSLPAKVDKLGCRAILSPPSLTYSAFGGSTSVQVTTTLSDCRWTAVSDASWLPLNYDPHRSGNGIFTYTVPPNSGTAPRTASIRVGVVGGPAVVHAVQQERPAGCSYLVSPDKVTLPASGGAGAFDLVTTPGDCQWTISNSGANGSVRVTLTGPSSGTGAARITYSTAANPFSFDAVYTIEVRGLSGQNPPGRHTVTIMRGVQPLTR